MEFVRFPRTPHLAWLGEERPRDDKVLSSDEARWLLSHPVIVEEKVDGTNIGISVDSGRVVRVQSRGAFLSWDALHPQFKPLRQWLATHHGLVDALTPDLILFGEWCYATHSIHYTKLPDWFIAFDIYDHRAGKFWSTERRNTFVLELGTAVIPRIAQGTFSVEGVRHLLGPSRFSDGPAEGLYLRWDRGDHLEGRAKLVRTEFIQTIGEHWSRHTICRNRLVADDEPSAVRLR